MTEKEFWAPLDGKEFVQMMSDAQNFKFYNKLGRYKFLKYSGSFEVKGLMVCINIVSCGEWDHITEVIITKKSKVTSKLALFHYQRPQMRKFIEEQCGIVLSF
jgi:hypothetical protein